jgi:Na+-transporting NADH:ubiquinone oxidoreductase subunit C
MKQTNTYIFVYASAMVIIVAAILSFVATILKPYQDLNVEIAKKLDILRSVEKGEMAYEVSDRNTYVEEEYDQYIVDSYVINHLGERQDGIDAFTVNVREELRKPVSERYLPIFVFRMMTEMRNILYLFTEQDYGDRFSGMWRLKMITIQFSG